MPLYNTFLCNIKKMTKQYKNLRSLNKCFEPSRISQNFYLKYIHLNIPMQCKNSSNLNSKHFKLF